MRFSHKQKPRFKHICVPVVPCVFKLSEKICILLKIFSDTGFLKNIWRAFQILSLIFVTTKIFLFDSYKGIITALH